MNSATCVVFHTRMRHLAEHRRLSSAVWCSWCGHQVSLGESNNRIPRREMRLARLLVDNWILWEPGAGRRAADDYAIDACAGMR